MLKTNIANGDFNPWPKTDSESIQRILRFYEKVVNGDRRHRPIFVAALHDLTQFARTGVPSFTYRTADTLRVYRLVKCNPKNDGVPDLLDLPINTQLREVDYNWSIDPKMKEFVLRVAEGEDLDLRWNIAKLIKPELTNDEPSPEERFNAIHKNPSKKQAQ